MLTLDQLKGCFPSTDSATLSKYLPALNKVAAEQHINTPLRMRAFLAQIGHESGSFKFVQENLNYSADGLLKIFRKYFTPAEAKKYARKPELIASRVYANRMGNGNEASGDGWKFKGRGLIQITGKNNYTALAAFLTKSLDDTVKYLETSEGAVVSAAWFWAANNLNRWADAQDMVSLTRRINGGTHGMTDRMAIFNRSKAFIK